MKTYNENKNLDPLKTHLALPKLKYWLRACTPDKRNRYSRSTSMNNVWFYVIKHYEMRLRKHVLTLFAPVSQKGLGI